jgi:serine/threonine-protein kinase
VNSRDWNSWNELVPHLDCALELDDPAREEFLRELEKAQPNIARDVRALLEERAGLDAQGFLIESMILPPPIDTLSGTRVGAYTIERLIGRGGMGEVWLAARSDGRFEGQCALKFLDASITSPKLVDRFHREGHLLARLTHPNIARLLDAGATPEGRAYLALEYVDGEPIDQYCDALAIEARVRLFVEVVAAVAHAHSQLVIHRDIKPSNVLVTREGQVKLLDFGIAKLMSADPMESGSAMTRVEDSLLTPQYAAPEQLLGDTPSTATDVYQLGMLLYVLLTGRHPLPPTSTHADRLRAVFEATLPRASEGAVEPAHKALRGDLDAILDVALRSDPTERYATAQALKEDLLRYLNREPVAAREGATWYRTKKFMARHRWSVAGSALAAVCLCAALVFALVQAREAARQRDAARRELVRATASNDFTTFLLSVAAPGNTKFSAAELLDESERLIDKQYSGDDPLKADLLATVGVQYMQSERWEQATAALERAVQIADRSADVSLQGRTHCPLALLKMLNGDQTGAESLMKSTLESIPAGPEYAQIRAECLTRFSEFGYFNGDSAAMIKHASDALALLDLVPNASIVRRIDAQSSLAYGYYLARDNAKADAAFASTVANLEAAGRGRTLAAADVFNNWALVHFRGDIRKAEPKLRRTLELRRSIEGADGVVPTTLHNYAGLMLRLGKFDEAALLFEETIRTATARQEARIMFDAMMELADLRIQTGELDKAEAQLAQLAPHLNAPRFDDRRRAQLAYYTGHLFEKRGRFSEARTSYLESLRLVSAAKEKITMDVHTFAGLARTELALGDSSAAADASQRALTLAQSFADPQAPSYLIAEALLAVGDTQRATGSADSALDTYRLALENSELTLGADHPLTIEARDKSSD